MARDKAGWAYCPPLSGQVEMERRLLELERKNRELTISLGQGSEWGSWSSCSSAPCSQNRSRLVTEERSCACQVPKLYQEEMSDLILTGSSQIIPQVLLCREVWPACPAWRLSVFFIMLLVWAVECDFFFTSGHIVLIVDLLSTILTHSCSCQIYGIWHPS